MKEKKFISFINNPNIINTSDIGILDNILLEHPYCQTAQILLTKGLLNTDSIRYNRQLKKAAAYCSDRKKLFGLITLKKTPSSKEFKEKQANSTKDALGIGKPLEFKINENHSFSEWLKLIDIKEIRREKKEVLSKFSIKEFKPSKPKKKAFFKPIDLAKDSLIENEDLVTPVLAKVYLEQGHYEKSIKAYEKLIFKYPKKSSFFAKQIKLIKKLNK